jgi:hypothetical protein
MRQVRDVVQHAILGDHGVLDAIGRDRAAQEPQTARGVAAARSVLR